MMSLKQTFNLLIVFIFFCSGALAQTKDYRYQMTIKGVTNKWHSLKLPNSIYRFTKANLEDLRIYGFNGKDSVEVPYILEKSADQIVERELNFKTINESRNQDGYYFTFESNDLLPINQFRLNFEQLNFDWKVSLEGSTNNNDWFKLLTDERILSIKNNHTNYRFTQLDFPIAKYRFFRLHINADVQPKLSDIKILKTDTIKGVKQPVSNISFQLNNESKTKLSIVEITLPTLLPIADLTLDVSSPTDYYRPLKIEYAIDSVKTEKGIQYNYNQLLESNISSLEASKFSFNGVFAKRIRITVENNDNEPLNIQSATVNATVYELVARFNRQAYKYRLYFGNNRAKAPVYDLKNFENKIPIAMTELTLERVQPNPAYLTKDQQPFFQNKLWIWVLMGLIIGVLGFFTLRMLKDVK